jgi:hypothetical protein
MKRYREQPSLWHVVVTCFALAYVLEFIVSGLNVLVNPAIPHTFWFWATAGIGGLVLGWVLKFLIGELVRQARLFKQWKRP